MSPLARRLQARQQEMGYREMERFVWDAKGIRFTSSSFEQVAKDQRADRLTAEAIKAVATVLDLPDREVADLDDERWGITRQFVAREASAEDKDVDLGEIPTDELLAEIARRAGANNPDRKR
jgi:hypothetical protein